MLRAFPLNRFDLPGARLTRRRLLPLPLLPSCTTHAAAFASQDAHATVLGLDDDTAFFGVYDGHGGKEVIDPPPSLPLVISRLRPTWNLPTWAEKEKNWNEAGVTRRRTSVVGGKCSVL